MSSTSTPTESSCTTVSEPCAEPSAKKAKLTTSDFEMPSIVVFVVGNQKKVLQMPRRIARESSDLIDAECKDLSDTAVYIKLYPNIPVEIFTLFLVWLSTGDLNNAEEFASHPANPSAVDLEDTSKKLNQLAQCYHLAEILIARPFQNYITDQICKYLESLVDKDDLLEKTIARNVPLVYVDGQKESKLKCLLEDAIVASTTNLTRCMPIDNPELEPMVLAFWNGVAISAIRRNKELEDGRMRFPLNWGEERRCKYHEHKNDDEIMDCRERRLEKQGRMCIDQ
ncbi:hypothetical protein V499_05526 [Pseudogymnoascus sp. VKM F-103]|uniref:BTB domain-containing protein n=1 Tax=Pseudogymnoascus verrucosus TaxID=342668 RepID=A0A1B8GQB4_9PEZI|nr:uncharacterized protein VE01_04024 [Pseudogymnoascus verrucosus]KFY74447.1 hypothetical protein V499_05526 [Pseudogymnoascus sp. VKM F-103]OBT98029.1 hypothetical protein VE01_04024 [Pseudogymnoascus verrucosus]